MMLLLSGMCLQHEEDTIDRRAQPERRAGARQARRFEAVGRVPYGSRYAPGYFLRFVLRETLSISSSALRAPAHHHFLPEVHKNTSRAEPEARR